MTGLARLRQLPPRATSLLAALGLLSSACALRRPAPGLPGFTPLAGTAERALVLELYPGVTATLVAPAQLDPRRPVELILYALPNGNTTAETMGRAPGAGVGWRYDIQHIGAQTRALRARGVPQAVVAYLEADTRSWPEWRRRRGYERANRRIVEIVDQLRTALGHPPQLSVTLTGHSGGGSFAWGFLDARAALPDWLDRIAFLDSNYSFEPRHGDKLAAWLRRSPAHTLVVLAYDDREIVLDGRKVITDSTGGTWRASQRMMEALRRAFPLVEDELGEFRRFHHPQLEFLLHPNPGNRILHTALVGELNGYLHALLLRRKAYERGEPVLGSARVYASFIAGDVILPPPVPPAIPARDPDAPGGSAFVQSVAALPREEREAAILRELLAGNIPAFLRRLRTVQVSAPDTGGVTRTLAFEVMPDYLAIGSDEDWVRMPMDPYTAQAFCDAFGFVLPTPKLVNDTWAAAPVHVEPHPLTVEREAPLTFLQHHRIIEAQLDSVGAPHGTFVGGIKKDVVLSNRLQERPARVAIYGWHYRNGSPIQPVYAGHVDWYVDYSHGIRPVRRRMLVDGSALPFERILDDPSLLHLLSDEGPLAVRRYER